MDYSDFLSNYDSYNEYNRIQRKNKKEEDAMWGSNDSIEFDACSFVKGLNAKDVIHFDRNDGIWGGAEEDTIFFDELVDDRVNSPSHYMGGKTEVIDIIEDAVKDAPKVRWGLLQGQVLKYMLRLWLKDNPIEDAKKARWYLDRLINKLEKDSEHLLKKRVLSLEILLL